MASTVRFLAALLLCLGLASCRDSGEKQGSAPAPVAQSTPDSVAPSGPEILPADADRVLAAVRESGGRAVLVNVWATWCIPCREEFPDLMRLRRTYRDRGLELVLVSADWDEQLPAAKEFLAQHGVDFPTWQKTGDDMKFINTLSPRWGGALPATFLYDAKGELRYFRQSKATYALLEDELLKVLGGEKAPSKEEPS